MNKKEGTQRGITLIALIITIIVMLILVSVTISMAVNGGLFDYAGKAVGDTNNAIEREQTLADGQISVDGKVYNSIDDILIGLGSIDWEKAFAEEKAPQSQDEERNNDVIGIGTDGKAVDMDLWKYTLLDNGTFRLNDEAYEESGYIGGFTEKGEIIGTIPQYISIDGGANYKAVTNLVKLFYNCTELCVAPQIPTTVTSMGTAFSRTSIEEAPIIPTSVTSLNWTFEYTNLKEMPDLPNSVTLMNGTFNGCESLIKLTELPDSVTTLVMCFSNCISLSEVPNSFIIPESVTTIKGMFAGCSDLEKIPDNFIIPRNVDNVDQAFWNCTKLSGSLIMDCSPTTYWNINQNCTKTLTINYTKNCTNIDNVIEYSKRSSC